MLSAEAVSDVRLVPYSSGVGSFEVLVVPAGNDISASTLEAIAGSIREVSAFGTYVTVRTPDKVRLEISVQLMFKDTARSADKQTIRTQAQQAILNYIRSLRLADTFSVTEMTARIMNVSTHILDMKVLLFRVNGSSVPLRNIKALDDEVFVPDNTTTMAIRVV